MNVCNVTLSILRALSFGVERGFSQNALYGYNERGCSHCPESEGFFRSTLLLHRSVRGQVFLSSYLNHHLGRIFMCA